MRVQVAILSIVAVAAVGAFAGSGLVPLHMAALFVGALILANILGRFARTETDVWLPGLMTTAMIAKLAGSAARYLVLFVAYGGSGDARRYHTFGAQAAEIWRGLNVPDVAAVGFGGEGTRFVVWVTGLIYTPYEPSLMGGFWIFSILAFIGQFLLYLAFRQALNGANNKKYAVLVFFWPTLLYWPSSIGKEAVILVFLGLGSWAASHLYSRYSIRWIPWIALSAGIIGLIRIHFAALFAGAVVIGALLAKRPAVDSSAARKVLVGLIGLAALLPLAEGVSEEFDITLDSQFNIEEVDAAFSNVEDRTQTGGSSVSTGTIRSPADIPAAVLKVLFRPLPTEAGNVQMLAASLEGMLLLSLVLWRFPTMIGRARQMRSSPYLLFCLVYSALFVWAWSAILNLGILSRQRSLLLPFVLALIAGLGWNDEGHTHRDESLMDPSSHATDAVPPLRTPIPALSDDETTPIRH